MAKNSCGCGCSDSGCCSPPQTKKLIIDFLYLNLNICERCQGTEKNLDEAVDEVSAVLTAAGYDLIVNKVNITSKELADQYEFLSSPTIRVNGNDIALEVKESLCEDCGDLCGDDVDCRVWTYDGIDYNEPPKALIINAILKEIYGNDNKQKKKGNYQLPENLAKFFDGKKQLNKK